MKFGRLILINLLLSFWFLYIAGISVKGTFGVVISLHLRLELLPAINSVVSSRLYRGLKLEFISLLVLVLCSVRARVWIMIEK